MAKRFNKTIVTQEQKNIYNLLVTKEQELKKIEQNINKEFYNYYQIEGKYSIGTMRDEWAGRGYLYQYRTQKDKEKEKQEQEQYYQNFVLPLKKQQEILIQETKTLSETLCQLLWNCDITTYRKKQSVKNTKKEIEKLYQKIQQLEQFIKENS